MCLDYVFNEEEEKAVLDTLPDTFEVWKLFRLKDGEYKTGYFYEKVHPGVNIAGVTKILCSDRSSSQTYFSGFHACLTEEDLKRYVGGVNRHERIIKCTVHKEHIINVGRQTSIYSLRKPVLVLVFSQIEFPY